MGCVNSLSALLKVLSASIVEIQQRYSINSLADREAKKKKNFFVVYNFSPTFQTITAAQGSSLFSLVLR
jgi:hypothetical protein